ncbi:DUF222 domain-containing protein, partial [Haloactinopolyspora alba]|uniref:DUF222 domain-containing protein n=1 Tax=Haloactinopolyspora alba TaxID=648780 RepID=UPI00101C4E2F
MGSVEVDRLVTVVQALAAAPAGELDDAVVAEELLALRRLADVAEAAYLSRLAVFDTRGVARRSEALSTRQWLRHHAHVAPGETTRAVKTAKRLTELPVVAAALAAGEIRRPHADAIVDAAALLGTDVIAGCQDALVDAARTDEPTRLRAALRGLGAATENTRAVREAEKRDQDRWLDLNTTFDGAVHLQGVLGAEDGAIVKAAVDALAAPDTTHPRAGHGVAGREDAGRGGGRDMRTSAQRRADALVELARR